MYQNIAQMSIILTISFFLLEGFKGIFVHFYYQWPDHIVYISILSSQVDQKQKMSTGSQNFNVFSRLTS